MPKQKSKQQIDRLNSIFTKLIKNGITRDKIESIKNYREYNKLMGTKKTSNKSMNSDKRLLKQVWDNRKQVILYHEKKNKITSNDYKNFLRRQMTKQFILHKEAKKSEKKKMKKQRREFPDIQVNGYVHEQPKSFTIKTMKDLEDFISKIDKSGQRYSKQKDIKISEEELERLKNIRDEWRIYQNFDYGDKINV